ncbi:MAG: heme NO-binding domain-containing protein [Spirochaetota bacterium]
MVYFASSIYFSGEFLGKIVDEATYFCFSFLMYGIVNRSLVKLLQQEYGEETWLLIREKSGIGDVSFLGHVQYDDQITYQIVVTASEVLQASPDALLYNFGIHWILSTSKEEYPLIMQSSGTNLKEFFINLPNFHNRISLIYPQLSPPEFRVSHIAANSLELHYESERQGLESFVEGLIEGLSRHFGEKVLVEHIASRKDGSEQETFRILWQ